MIGCDTTRIFRKLSNIRVKDTERTKREVDTNTRLPRGRNPSDSDTAGENLPQPPSDMFAKSVLIFFTF